MEHGTYTTAIKSRDGTAQCHRPCIITHIANDNERKILCSDCSLRDSGGGVERSYWIGDFKESEHRQKLKITTLENAGLHDNAGVAAFGRTGFASPAQQGTENSKTRRSGIRTFVIPHCNTTVRLFVTGSHESK